MVGTLSTAQESFTATTGIPMGRCTSRSILRAPRAQSCLALTIRLGGRQICGQLRRDSSILLCPAKPIYNFDFPRSTFTSLNGINDKGVICGRYVDASGTHGFLAGVRGTPPTDAAGPEMKVSTSPSRITPLNSSPSAWGDAMQAR